MDGVDVLKQRQEQQQTTPAANKKGCSANEGIRDSTVRD